jgi:hypothetical protein
MTVYAITTTCNCFHDYRVEADSKDDAVALVLDGLVEPCDQELDHEEEIIFVNEEETKDIAVPPLSQQPIEEPMN